MLDIDALSFLAIVACGALAAGIASRVAPQLLIPVVVLEMFLLVRGLPAIYLYREALELRDRAALALFSATELPLVVAITTIAVERGDMESGTAASLVGAAVASTALFPLIALKIRGGERGASSTPVTVRR